MTRPLLDGLVVRPHHTALCVDDFDAARDFFTGLVGMQVEGEMDQRSSVVGRCPHRKSSYPVRREILRYPWPDSAKNQ